MTAYTLTARGALVECSPELYALLCLPRAHPWAKSVRWSCGRPGFTTAIRIHEDPDGRWGWDLARIRAEAYAAARCMPPGSSITVSAT